MVYVFLADGFEEIEAITVVDILRRNFFETMIVGVSKERLIGVHGIEVRADILQEDVKLDDSLELVVLPGGMPGAENLYNSSRIHEVLDYANENNKLIGAICAAPLVLGRKKMLVGKRAVCFPGFESELLGAVIVGTEVTAEGNIITAKRMESSMEFAKALVVALQAERYRKEIENNE